MLLQWKDLATDSCCIHLLYSTFHILRNWHLALLLLVPDSARQLYLTTPGSMVHSLGPLDWSKFPGKSSEADWAFSKWAHFQSISPFTTGLSLNLLGTSRTLWISKKARFLVSFLPGRFLEVIVITPKAVTPGFKHGSYPVAGYALTTELYDHCSLEAWVIRLQSWTSEGATMACTPSWHTRASCQRHISRKFISSSLKKGTFLTSFRPSKNAGHLKLPSTLDTPSHLSPPELLLKGWIQKGRSHRLALDHATCWGPWKHGSCILAPRGTSPGNLVWGLGEKKIAL